MSGHVSTDWSRESSVKLGPGRVVRAVDLSVTVLATSIQQPRVRGATTAGVPSNEQIVGVTSIRMTLLAQKWPRCGQQHVVIRAVGFMAIHAVVTHRRVFPEKRSALLGMARVANRIDAFGFEQG